MRTSFNPVNSGHITRVLRHLACPLLLLCSGEAYGSLVSVQNSALQVSVNTGTAEITVTDYSTGNIWSQAVPTMGIYTATASVFNPTTIQGSVTGPTGKLYPYTLTLRDATQKAFHLTVTPPDPVTGDTYFYAPFPPFPFVFNKSNATGLWYYVQNNGGEGTLLPVGNSKIRGFGGWSGGQPWWGITNLDQAMMARLDSFTRIQNPTSGGDISAYKIPLEIEYSFRATGGYVGLAKAYRAYFLSQNPSLSKLATRAMLNSKLNYLKDSTYAYFWDDYQTNFESLVTSMKSSGLSRMIAMFNQHDYGDRVTINTFNYLATTPNAWLGGVYRQATPNVELVVCKLGNWVTKLLTGVYSENDVLQSAANDGLHGWDDLYTTDTAPHWTNIDVPADLTTYGTNLKLIYHDTLPQQVAPCIDDAEGYRESVETNQAGRQAILDGTRITNGLLAGSGEGVSAWWTILHLDYWEGGMEESVYADIDRHPIDDHGSDFQELWHTQATDCLLETERIPLLALQWHDYVGETWNWRNSTFADEDLVWKKDLFNILYGGVPMWHINNALWTAHSAEYIASYKKLLPVRQANGFAEMTNHGWPSDKAADRSVQYTDWDNVRRVIVNFGSQNYPYSDPTYGSATIPSHGYEMLPDTTAPAPVPTFTAAGGNTIVTLNWTLPPDGDLVSVKIKRSTNTYPTWTTGSEIYNGPNLTLTDMGLTNNRPYYYSAFAIDGKGNYSTAAQASATPH